MDAAAAFQALSAAFKAISEAESQERVPQILRALQEVQLETVRMENQEAIIEGFGVLSGRVKGPAGN